MARPENWQHTPGGRILVGVLLAIGLCYALMQATFAVSHALGAEETIRLLHPLSGLILLQGWQAVGLLAGGAVAGVGERRATAYGAMVGVLSGLLILAAILHGFFAAILPSFAGDVVMPGTLVRNTSLYAVPVVYAIIGALGGWVGQAIWPPLPEAGLADPRLAGPHGWAKARRRPIRPPRSLWDGPIAWPRVLLGAVLAVAGALYTKTLIDLLVLFSEGKLTVVTLLQDQVAYAEVFSLAILLGGCVAGVNTPNGLKQGMCVGIAAACILDGLLVAGFLNPAAPAIFPVLSTLFLGPIGGWMGSELLPPVCRMPRFRRAAWS